MPCTLLRKSYFKAVETDVQLKVTDVPATEDDKPVGTVCIAWCERNTSGSTTRINFSGDRQKIREQSCLLAMQGLLDILQKASD